MQGLPFTPSLSPTNSPPPSSSSSSPPPPLPRCGCLLNNDEAGYPGKRKFHAWYSQDLG